MELLSHSHVIYVREQLYSRSEQSSVRKSENSLTEEGEKV